MKSQGSSITIIGKDFRIFHVLLIAGSGFLLYSALGLDDDQRFVTGAFNMFYLHRYVGILWGAIVVFYAIYSLGRRQTRILEPLSKPFMEQIREGFSVAGRYLVGRSISERVRGRMGRHNILASYAFLGMLMGMFFLGIGGIGLILTGAENGTYEVFLGIHVLGAGMLSLFVLAHLFAVINRANRPLLPAVFLHGRVSRRWAEESMPQFVVDQTKK